MATFFQAETPANLEKLPQTNKEYAVKHIFNTRNHARFKGELFYRWKNEGDEKKRRKGEGKRGNEGGRGGKGGGEKGEWHREGGGNEAENTHKENTEKAQRERKAQGRR